MCTLDIIQYQRLSFEKTLTLQHFIGLWLWPDDPGRGLKYVHYTSTFTLAVKWGDSPDSHVDMCVIQGTNVVIAFSHVLDHFQNVLLCGSCWDDICHVIPVPDKIHR